MTNTDSRTMLAQRRILGVLCALLVPACVGFGFIGHETNLPYWYNSISSTFYANSNVIMIGLLFATSVFFFSYKGYDWKDRLCSIVQAIACIGIVLFPVETHGAPARVGLFNLELHVSNIVHYCFAFLLFIAFGVNTMFLFTKHGETMTNAKKIRNRLYRVCGSLIFLGIIIQVIIGTGILFFIPKVVPLTMINEFMMLEAFALAYIIKSESIAKLNDKPE